MAYRSEAGKIGNKTNYQDLNMTQYPNNLDTRSNNTNMKGFTNVGEQSIPDYVMAEYVNALSDGLMAVQRSLGTNPMVPSNTAPAAVSGVIESSTVSKRIGNIENGLLDERYGGAGWVYNSNRPTLSRHNHDGLNGHPGKINLQREVEGLLQKSNLNLSPATGLTGADILVSKSNGRTIDVALSDMLSKTTGGIVRGAVVFKGGMRSRTTIECTASEMNPSGGAVLVNDGVSTDSKAVQVNAATGGTLHSETLGRDLLFGKYVLGLRVKTNSLTSQNLLRVQAGDKTFTFHGAELKVNNGYVSLYVVFDHSLATDTLVITKVATSTAVALSIDNFFIQPVHPAIFDR